MNIFTDYNLCVKFETDKFKFFIKTNKNTDAHTAKQHMESANDRVDTDLFIYVSQNMFFCLI